VVHLPEDAGAIDSHVTQALIAHELTHVLHQRALGPLAVEDGPLGDSLEAQADAVERSHLGEAVDNAEFNGSPEVDLSAAGLTWTPGTGFQIIPGGLAPETPWEPPAVSSGVRPQRSPVSGPPVPQAPPDAESPLFPDAAGDGREAPVDVGVVPLRYPADFAIQDGVPVASLDAPTTSADQTLSEDEMARVAERVYAGLVVPTVDPKDPDLLDALAAGLYGRLRTSLRGELIVDRERAGLLTEFH
jgi:hypothetical protein